MSLIDKIQRYAMILVLSSALSACSLLGSLVDEELDTKTKSGKNSGVFEEIGKVLDKNEKEIRHERKLEQARKDARENALRQETGNIELECEESDTSQVCTLNKGCWCESL